MKPIGGYFELECGNTSLYYEDGIYLNICRNAIRYLIRTLGISRIHIPYFTCHVVSEAIQKEGCEVIKYYIDENLIPINSIPKEDFMIYNNYFGVSGDKINELSSIYPNLIVDNAQAFFSMPSCRAAIYSPRKFFGLPDGGILRGKDIPVLELEQGSSMDVMSHLLKRIEMGAQSGYPDFVSNDKKLDLYPLKRMSNLTLSLMGNINYVSARIRRIENFNYLKDNLETDFPISMSSDDVPMVFPYLSKNGNELRNKLISNNIFCAKYWPNVMTETPVSSIEYSLTNNLVSIPIDQRYNIEDMKIIVDLIKS